MPLGLHSGRAHPEKVAALLLFFCDYCIREIETELSWPAAWLDAQISIYVTSCVGRDTNVNRKLDLHYTFINRNICESVS